MNRQVNVHAGSQAASQTVTHALLHALAHAASHDAVSLTASCHVQHPAQALSNTVRALNIG